MSSTVQGLRQSLFTVALTQANMDLYAAFLRSRYPATATPPQEEEELYWAHLTTDRRVTLWSFVADVSLAVESRLDMYSWSNWYE